MNSVTRFVEGGLKLIVNREKSAVRKAGHMELLGYGVYRMRNQQFGLKVIEDNREDLCGDVKRSQRKGIRYPSTNESGN